MAQSFRSRSAVNSLFCALFGMSSIVKLFCSFEYQKILPFYSLWTCPLYRDKFFKDEYNIRMHRDLRTSTLVILSVVSFAI